MPTNPWKLLALTAVALLWSLPVAAQPGAESPEFAPPGQYLRAEVVPLPALDQTQGRAIIHWTPAKRQEAQGAKGGLQASRASHPPLDSGLDPPTATLLSRGDLYANTPLPDPAFEFKGGPASLHESHDRRPVQPGEFKLLPLPVNFSAGGLAGDLESGPNPVTGGPAFGADGRLQDSDEQGGFLAVRWRPDSNLGLTLGGGYQRGHTATTGDGYSWQVVTPGSVMAMRDVPGAGATAYNSYGRWAAFMALPYQLSEAIGLRPEVSYYYSEVPELGRVSGNEWVMGLQFTFGF